MPAATYLRNFASDRSHMLAAEGEATYNSPPPEWPPTVNARGETHTLPRFLDMGSEIEDIDALIDYVQRGEGSSRASKEGDGADGWMDRFGPYGAVVTQPQFLKFCGLEPAKTIPITIE